MVLLFLVGCDEVRKSDYPVDRITAMKIADEPLPLPMGASNIRLRLSGGTQNWDLFLSFDAPLSELNDLIITEIGGAAKVNEQTENEVKSRIFERRLLPQSSTAQNLPLFKPRWWSPNSIKAGYYTGYDPDGPYIWVDTDLQRCFLFLHHN